MLVGGALRGGGSLAADGAFGTLTADGTSRPVYHSLKSNARTDAKVLKLCAPPLNAGMVLTCGQTRGVSAFRWKDYEVTTTKESSKWWKKAKATTSRKRCWERSGDLKGARDWGLCLASDARGSYAVAGCRGGDLKLWRPPKAEQSGINRWVEAGVAERSHDSSRMRSDVRAAAAMPTTLEWRHRLVRRMGRAVRSRRPAVPRCLHAIDARGSPRRGGDRFSGIRRPAEDAL